MLIPMYVFTILFVALPILYLFLLSFLQRAQVWGVDFTFTLDNYKRILEPLYLDTFWQSLKLAFTATFFVALIGYPYGYFMAKMNAVWKRRMLLLIMIPFWTSALIDVYKRQLWIREAASSVWVSLPLISIREDISNCPMCSV